MLKDELKKKINKKNLKNDSSQPRLTYPGHEIKITQYKAK
jgi:hypothetical protein